MLRNPLIRFLITSQVELTVYLLMTANFTVLCVFMSFGSLFAHLHFVYKFRIKIIDLKILIWKANITTIAKKKTVGTRIP